MNKEKIDALEKLVTVYDNAPSYRLPTLTRETAEVLREAIAELRLMETQTEIMDAMHRREIELYKQLQEQHKEQVRCDGCRHWVKHIEGCSRFGRGTAICRADWYCADAEARP